MLTKGSCTNLLSKRKHEAGFDVVAVAMSYEEIDINAKLVDRILICISDIYLIPDKYKRHSAGQSAN